MKRREELELPEFAREAVDGGADPRLLDVLAELGPLGATPSAGLRARLLAEIATPRRRFAPLYDALSDLFDLGDEALAALFERAASPSEWSLATVPLVRLLHLTGGPRVAVADNGLVRLAAGGRFPTHRHLGQERVLVLEGGYKDEQSGRVYLPGDLHEMPAGSTHAYVALPERELLLAVSVVSGVEVEGFGVLTPSSAAR
jgi:quercetin dioxygenase-like cupin family protein